MAAVPVFAAGTSFVVGAMMVALACAVGLSMFPGSAMRMTIDLISVWPASLIMAVIRLFAEIVGCASILACGIWPEKVAGVQDVEARRLDSRARKQEDDMQRLQDNQSILVAKHNRLNYQLLELVALIERLETRLVRLRHAFAVFPRSVSLDDFMSDSLTAKAAMVMQWSR
jgi:hypothetical protein